MFLLTVAELSAGQPLPDSISLEVTDIEWHPGQSRRAEVILTDSTGEKIRFIDYDGANLTVDWTLGHRYRISRCGVQKGRGEIKVHLASSTKTRVTPLGNTQTTQLLVLGDTHVGRDKHPGSGFEETINPREAFKTAVHYGVQEDVEAVVHAGDIFHGSADNNDAEYIDTHIFAPLAAADIPFYYVSGNHSSEPGDDLLTRRTGPLVTTLTTTGTPLNSHVRLFGINHHANGDLPWKTLTFPETVDESVSILLLHQTLKQLTADNSQAVDLARIAHRFPDQFDYVFSGHHHDAAKDTWEEIPVQYTGAAEQMSTNNDPIDRVAWLITIENTAVTSDRYNIP
ncbi:metallophosphoesterase [Halobellus ruber]|uniref:Metallophosphoesterase family protein n=1 Tax=Halobellus ruber TaxID=2761102 RepID=A0A7J9SD94_9EURY|nr:metallophosphoesterase family protein [Halobellus ruber]MBB6644885.1 metallophosphoesterase family protein [Halobellus ruber]